MEILTFPLGVLQTNCYLAFDKKTSQAVIIDPADAGDFLAEQVSRLKLKPIVILATHGHFDHVLASLELKLNFRLPFLMSKTDQFLLSQARKRAIFYTQVDPRLDPAKPDGFLKENYIVRFGSEELKVIETPGHTPGSLCFYNKKGGILFSGDTIFKEAVGRTDLPKSSEKQLKNSVEKLIKLPDKTIVYPGHGQKTTLAEFKKYLATLVSDP